MCSIRARSSRATSIVLVALLAVSLLAGCASAPREIVRRVEVQVPVPCPAPQRPPRPHLPLTDMPQDATAADIARATAASLEALTGYAAALETLLGPSE
jgi:hypothetical protein